MDANKILSANILDLVFDDRNKEYGAYELRKTYPKRIAKALFITSIVAIMAFTGTVLANTFKSKDGKLAIKEVTIQDIKEPEKEPEKIPEPEKKPEEIKVKTIQLTPPAIVDDKQVEEPPPTQDDAENAKVDLKTQDGVDDIGLVEPTKIEDPKGIIEEKVKDDTPFTVVEVDAKYEGWEKFLRQNLNGEVPAENGAPAGRYTVVMQFVVDVDGTVSNIQALTAHGYGMEQEAMRVLKRAKKWTPAYQNKSYVKAYRKQPITFEVLSE